jgi:hypothetical protein
MDAHLSVSCSRDLVAEFGDEYRDYRERVGMLVPKGSLSQRIADKAKSTTT